MEKLVDVCAGRWLDYFPYGAIIEENKTPEVSQMRGIPSLITDIRKNVFTEVARMAYAGGDYSKAEDLP